MNMPRIALFSDSYHEANGVARTTAAIEACAKKRNIPLLSVHAGPETRLVHDGSIAFPSETDTVGNVVLEAMASGVPVVAMASGGPRFMVGPGRTAIVAADRAAFIQGVRTLVRNRERREAMGAAARSRAKDLMSWDRIFLDVCTAYEAALVSGKRDARNVMRPSIRSCILPVERSIT